MNSSDHSGNDQGQKIWAVGSGKGGVGKSLVAANFAVVLASLGKKVVAVDLDLGNANLHTCLGIRYPQKTLIDFLNGQVRDLQEIILDTSLYNLKFISGSGGVMGLANPWHAQKLKLLRYLEKLCVDHIVLDLGAGTSYNIIDFFLGATDHILVATPEASSIQSVYNFVRICLFRKLHSIFKQHNEPWSIVEQANVTRVEGGIIQIQDLLDNIRSKAPESVDEFSAFLTEFRPNLILNMVLKSEESKLGGGLREVIKRYLNVNVDYVGAISFDKGIRRAVSSEVPFIVRSPKARPTLEFFETLPGLLGDNARGNFNGNTLKEMAEREIRRTSKTYSSRIVEANSREVDPSIYVVDKVKSYDSGESGDFTRFFSFKASSWSKIAVDIGTSSTRIFVKGKGIVLDEPSLMSIDDISGKVVSLGHETKAMLGRSHAGIRILAPMESGAISDYSEVKLMVHEFIKRAKQSTLLIRPGVVLTIPLGLTSVERKAVNEFIGDLGARETHLVYEPVASAVGGGLPVDLPAASMVVNIGGGSISAVVIAIGGLVKHNSARIGSNAIDTAIIRYLRDHHNFHVGGQTAEWIKVNFAEAVKQSRDRKFEIRGQDLANGIPKTLSVSLSEIRNAIQKPVTNIVKVIQQLLESIPPELSGDLVDRGMLLTGGGSLLKGLDAYITTLTGVTVTIAQNAQTAAVEGAGRMLDDFKLYGKFFVDENKP